MSHDRTKFVGGSDIASILGISPWKTAADLWLDKTLPTLPDTDSAPKARGRRLEPYIRDMIAHEYGMQIGMPNQRYKDRKVPYFAVEIDAETISAVKAEQESAADEPKRVLERIENIEIKTVHPFNSRDWGKQGTDALPIHYVAQCQWGLGVTGREVCHVFALIGDDLRQYRIDRDEETIAAMRERAVEFWERYVLTKLRPPLDYASPRIAETLKRLYPGTDGTTRDANDDDIHWRSVLAKAEEKRDGYQGVIDGARAHLLERMGTAAFLRFNDGKAFRRKETTRKGYTVEPVTYVDFRLVNIKE